MEKIGWDFPEGEDYLKAQLRPLLITSAGLAGHEATVAEAQKRFKAYTSGSDRNAIHASLRSAVWPIAIRNDQTDESYRAMQKEFLTTTSIDGKELALSAMGRVQSPELGRDVFNFILSDKVAVQDVHSAANTLASNAKTRYTLWDCIKEDWQKVNSRVGQNSVVMDRFLRLSLNKFADHAVEQDIDKFFSDKDVHGYDRSLGIVKDTIKANASYRARDEEVLKEWLKTHGYM